MLLKISQNDAFVLFRSEDVVSIQPVMSQTCRAKYYLLLLTFSEKKIRLSIEEANYLAKLLRPTDLSLADAELQQQLETIDILKESLG
jgi:hypothetical protein